MEVTNASRAGAQYGSQSAAKSSDIAGMQAAAVLAAPDITSPAVSAVASRVCQCATSSGTFIATSPANDCANACTGNHLVISVTVRVTRTFTTIAHVPGIPTTINISRSTTLRAQ
jgi:hypothetical protein